MILPASDQNLGLVLAVNLLCGGLKCFVFSILLLFLLFCLSKFIHDVLVVIFCETVDEFCCIDMFRWWMQKLGGGVLQNDEFFFHF